MQITEVRIKLADAARAGNDKVLAYCSVTFDGVFCVKEMKLISAHQGVLLCMPSRKLSTRCRLCQGKVELVARFCGRCGVELEPATAEVDDRGRAKLHADYCHPLNAEFRRYLQAAVIAAYEAELARAAAGDATVLPRGDEGDAEAA